MDDLLLAATSAEQCLEATRTLLTVLAEKGYKVKKDKTQIARRTVTYLGRLISANSMTLTDSKKQSILNHGKPTIVKHMLAFLGLTGYSFSRCGARALGMRVSVVVARGLSSCGSRALERRLSSCGAWA